MYYGQYTKDIMNGRGIYIFNSSKEKNQNSLYYVGEFKSGVADGRGKMVFKDGVQINTNWEAGTASYWDYFDVKFLKKGYLGNAKNVAGFNRGETD